MSTISVQICYNNQKKAIKISLNKAVHQLLTESLELFQLTSTSTHFVLKYKKQLLDTSLLLRYCNISNNAIIDLISNESSSSATSSSQSLVKIALSVLSPSLLSNTSNNVSLNGSFTVDTTLLDLLNSFISKSQLTAQAVSNSSQIIVVFQRVAVESNAYENTTLSLLGLTSGQNVRLQLRLKDSMLSNLNQVDVKSVDITDNVSTSVTSSEETSEVVDMIADNTSNVSRVDLDDSRDIVTDVNVNQVDVLAQDMDSTVNDAVIDSDIITSAISMDIDNNNVNNNDNMQCNINNIMIEDFNQGDNTSTSISRSDRITAAIKHILSHNFDVKSTPAIITVTKYIINILNNPTDIKYCFIKLSNRIFVERVSTVDGAHELLREIGYQPYSNKASSDANTERIENMFLPLQNHQYSSECEQFVESLVSVTDLKVRYDDIYSLLDYGALTILPTYTGHIEWFI